MIGRPASPLAAREHREQLRSTGSGSMVGAFAGQPQHQRLVGGVPFAGPGERTDTPLRPGDDIGCVASRCCRYKAAAFIGPTVWDDDGPMPILNRSNALIMECSILRAAMARGLGQEFVHVVGEGTQAP